MKILSFLHSLISYKRFRSNDSILLAIILEEYHYFDQILSQRGGDFEVIHHIIVLSIYLETIRSV